MFSILLLPVLLASWWGGLYAGLVASGLAVVGAWDLGTDSPFLDFTTRGEPINLFSAFALFMAGLLVSLSQEAIRRRGMQLVLLERARFEERKAAEQSLRRFKSTHDAVFMFDPDTLRFFYVNQGACDQVGYTEAELLGMHPYDLKPEYPDADFRRRVAPLRDGTVQSLRFETVYRHKDGHDVPVEVFLQHITPAGEPPRFVAIITDITSRKAAETDLQRTRDALARAQQVAGIAVFEVELPSMTLTWSEEMKRLHGLDSTAPTPTRTQLKRLTHPDDRESVMQTWKRALQEQGAFDADYRVRWPDGSEHWISQRAEPELDEQGNPVRYIGTSLDITARKQAEAALLAEGRKSAIILQTASDGIHVLNLEGKVVLLNDVFATMLGYTTAEAEHLCIWDWEKSIPEDQLHEGLTAYRDPAFSANFESLWQRKDGSVLDVEITARAVNINSEPLIFASARDISERKQAEAALIESETKFRTLFDEAPDAYLLMDSRDQGRITACNKAAQKMLRGPTEQIIGKTPADLSPLRQPDGQLSTEAAQDRIRVVMETGSNTFEWMHQRLDGEEFWAQVTCSILPPADRGIMIIAWRDITEKKQILSVLESEVQKNRMLLQTACDSVHVLDARGQVLECSESFAAGLGYTVAEALQLNVCQWEAQIPPDQIPPTLDQLFSLQETRAFETQHRRRDGSVMMVEVRARPVLVAGRPLIYCASRDITERKALVSEVLTKGEQLSNALSIASAGAWRYDVAADLFHFDDDFYRMLGTSAAEVGGYALSASDYAHRFIHPDDVSVVEEGIRKALAADDPSFTGLIEHRFLRKDKIGWMAVHYGVKQDDSGQISLLEGLNRVITEQKEGEFALQREKALSEAREAAEAANRAKSQFLSNMSHEIRTPLNIIIHSCYLLDKTRLDEQQANRVRTIETAGEALLWQINEILDLAKIESGEVPLQNHPFLLSAVWDDLDRIFTPEAESRGLTLTLPSASTLRAVRLHGDQGKLRQTLTNLVANALKFTEHGEVRVEAALRTEMTGATWLTVRVRDTGIGIPDDQLDALFKPFSQLDTSDTRRFGGTGLGLSIVKLMSERVGGQVGVESSPGQGSCFWIDWPFESLPLVPEESRPALPGDPAGLELADTCILVADDNAVAREVCRHVLETQGAQVELAASGKEALECIAVFPLRFDAVLMDIQMPGMDGLEACRHLRQGLASDDLPIIALSAGALSEQREAALAAGMTDFLSKPVKPRHLIETLRQRIAARRGEAVPHPTPIGPGQAPSDWPTIDGLERDQAYELLMGNLPLYGQLLTSFMARSPSLMETLSSPVTAKARAARHELLGMTGNIGATRLYRRLNALNGTRANGHFDRAAVEAVQASYRSLMDALDTHRADWQRPVSLEASTVDLSAQALHARLDALLEDVRQHHARALTEVDRLTPCWSGTPEETAWRLVSDALSRVDFPAAGQHLADFMRRLRTPPA